MSNAVKDRAKAMALVVDDDASLRISMKAALTKAGFDVIEAAGGKEAISQFEKEKPDLMTLDLSMPNKDGGQVFEELRRDPELMDIPVCIITGKPELRRLIYQRNVPPPEGYLDKPVEEKRLLLNVRKILSLRRGKR